MEIRQIPATTRSVVICGKGGVGKTVLTTLLTKVLVQARRKLLVIDADPVIGLPQALGVSVAKTMGNVSEELISTARGNDNQVKTNIVDRLDYMVLETLVELDGFALLTMGKWDGPGCFCPVNNILREAIGSLARSFNVILIDGEAGVEQVNRKVAEDIDTLVVVSDPTIRGIRTAALVAEVGQQRTLNVIMNVGIVISRTREGQEEQLSEAVSETGLAFLGSIPQDEIIAQLDLVGSPIYTIDDFAPSVAAAKSIAEKLGLMS
ncbi:MAG: AAA family ATPase [Chloroflexota bacterium]|nr:AAA family ATPase [Chloroflexota bacterium]